MTKYLAITLMATAICLANVGCMGRLIGEGMGAATGASGKAVDVLKTVDLSKYRGFKIESLTTAPGLKMPPKHRR